MQTLPLRVLPPFMATAAVLSARFLRSLSRILPLSQTLAKGKWITNRTGHLGFRARVFRAADGAWHYTITTRTGWHVAEYRYITTVRLAYFVIVVVPYRQQTRWCSNWRRCVLLIADTG